MGEHQDEFTNLLSISVRNLFPPALASRSSIEKDAEPSDTASEKRKRHCPAYWASTGASTCELASHEVLLRLRLDIVKLEGASDSGGTADAESTLYSNEARHATAQPRWDHLNEQLDVADGMSSSAPNLRARIFVIGPGGDSRLADVPLDPSQLRPLPVADKTRMFVPDALPPNCVLLHYDDGFTRIGPDIYQLLLREGVISDDVEADEASDAKSDQSNTKSEENEEIFEERAFNALGEEKDESPLDESALEKPSEPDDGDGSTRPKKDDWLLESAAEFSSRDATLDAIDERPGVLTETVTDTSINDLYNSTEPDLVEVKDSNSALGVEGIDNPEIMKTEELPLLVHDTSADRQRALSDEVQELRRLVLIEQRLLEAEERMRKEDERNLQSTVDSVKDLEHETSEICNAIEAERANILRSRSQLEAHRVHLLRQLLAIFPIEEVQETHNSAEPSHHYVIANLPLPKDIHSQSVTDEQISTALGFTCHALSLTSKYLAIPLRYQMVCKFSRSAIFSDQGTRAVYPLFRERGVIDRQQLDYGVLLLERNIQCLFSTRNLSYNPQHCLLKKLKVFLETIIG